MTQQAALFEARSSARIAADDAALGHKEEALQEAQHVAWIAPQLIPDRVRASLMTVIEFVNTRTDGRPQFLQGAKK